MSESHQMINQYSSGRQHSNSHEQDMRESQHQEGPQPSKFDLGPRWSSEEIHLFFDTFKRSGKDWQTIMDELHLQGFTHRTKEHIKSLYYKHKTYLSLASASASDLTAIMADYYKSLNLEKQRQAMSQQQPKEEFHCNENISEIKVTKKKMNRPGPYQSSSDNDDIDHKSSGDEAYLEQMQQKPHFGQTNTGYQNQQQVYRPQLIGRQNNEENAYQGIGQQQYQGGAFQQQRKEVNKYEQYVSRSAQIPHKYKSRQPNYQQYYPERNRTLSYGGNLHQNEYEQQNEEQGIMDTPSRQQKRKPQYMGLTQRRLFSEGTSPQRQIPQTYIPRTQQKYPGAYQPGFTGLQMIGPGGQVRRISQCGQDLMFARQLRKNPLQNVQRKGLAEGLNPYSFVVDEAESYQQFPNNKQVNVSNQKVSKFVMRWFKCEYFYSWIDRPFFLNHDFKQILNQLELGTIKLNKQEWVMVRKTLAGDSKKPRRFSERFIQEEREKLRTFRDIFREIIKSMQHKNFVPDQNGDLSVLLFDKKPQFDEEKIKEVLQLIKEYQIAPLVVGQRVLAIHPKSRELRTASLLTTDVQSYHAQFDKPELGVMIISDMHLIPISGSEYYQQQANQSSNLQLNNLRNLYLYNKFQNMISKVRDGSQGQIVGAPSLQNPFQPTQLKLDEDDMNFIPFEHTQFSKDNLKAMAILIILFERKNALIQEIRQLNDQFQKNPLYTEDFRQKYAWTAIQLQATNSIIEPVLTMFRFRSIKSEFLHIYEDQSNLEKEVSNQILEKATLIYKSNEEQEEQADSHLNVYKSNDNAIQANLENQMNEMLEPINEEDEDTVMNDVEEIPQIARQSIELGGIYQEMKDSFNIIIPKNYTISEQQKDAHQIIEQQELKQIIAQLNQGNEQQILTKIELIKSLLIKDNHSNDLIKQINNQISIIQKKLGKIAENQLDHIQIELEL